MKLLHALTGALALASNRTVVAIVLCGLYLSAGFVSPAAAQVSAPSALEWAAGQASAPAIAASACKGRRCRAVLARPMDIRSAPQIVAEAARYIGTRNPMRFRGPGCKAFINMVARRTGFATNSSLRAFDTRGMGQRVSYPQPGDYRVSARRGGGHVEIVASVDGGAVTTINGNKGRNRVGWSHRSIAGAAYYRPIRLASI